jgi:hypothetical protein
VIVPASAYVSAIPPRSPFLATTAGAAIEKGLEPRKVGAPPRDVDDDVDELRARGTAPHLHHHKQSGVPTPETSASYPHSLQTNRKRSPMSGMLNHGAGCGGCSGTCRGGSDRASTIPSAFSRFRRTGHLPFLDGASRARTGDLLGAISSRRFATSRCHSRIASTTAVCRDRGDPGFPPFVTLT